MAPRKLKTAQANFVRMWVVLGLHEVFVIRCKHAPTPGTAFRGRWRDAATSSGPPVCEPDPHGIGAERTPHPICTQWYGHERSEQLHLLTNAAVW